MVKMQYLCRYLLKSLCLLLLYLQIYIKIFNCLLHFVVACYHPFLWILWLCEHMVNETNVLTQ